MIDPSGNLWQADTGRNYSVTASGIANADIPAVYQKEAYATGSGLYYQFSVPNGSLNVKLRFAEIYLAAAGQRLVNIVINGSTVAAGFDILQHVPPNTAYDVTFPTNISNGQLTIQIVPTTGTAKLSGIEIY
jgi:hypothetical protein